MTTPMAFLAAVTVGYICHLPGFGESDAPRPDPYGQRREFSRGYERSGPD